LRPIVDRRRGSARYVKHHIGTGGVSEPLARLWMWRWMGRSITDALLPLPRRVLKDRVWELLGGVCES
jgi:hypothetical protein